MKHLRIYLMVAALFGAPRAHAYIPEPALPLGERVKMSSHIFIGEIQSVNFVNESGQVISAAIAARETDLLQSNPILATKIRVQETLLSRRGQLPRTVVLRYPILGAGYFQSEARPRGLATLLRQVRATKGQKFIFLTQIVEHEGKKPFFVSSYAHYYCEDVKSKVTILEAIFSQKPKSNQNTGKWLN
jgi:hypothetical protein